MNKVYQLKLLILLAVFLSPVQMVLAAVDCSQESIAFYLEKGFSQEQITRLCSDPKKGQAMPSDDKSEIEPTPKAALDPQPQIVTQMTDLSIYLQLAIKAQGIKISPEMISYKREECFESGDNESFIYNDRACGIIYTEIKVPGLEVISAKKGMFLIADTELIVKSNIRRKVVNTKNLSNASIRVLDRLLDKSPLEINIPLRDEYEPLDVAERLKEL